MEIEPVNTAQRTQLVSPPEVGPEADSSDPFAWPSDPFADDKRLLDLFKELKKEAYDNRWVYERKWWHEVLYLLDRQWIYYDSKRGQWLDKRMAKWIPRPVTNVIMETLSAIRSVFNQVQLQTKARPNGFDPVNVNTAETADSLEPALAEEHAMRSVMREFDFWFIATGNVFLRPWWDKRENAGVFVVSYEECMSCGQRALPAAILEAGDVCPSCGAPQLKQAVDEQGQPVTETFSQGRGHTDVLSPFEVACPSSYNNFEDVPYCITQRWRTKFWAEANLPKEVASKIRWEKLPHERSLQLVKALASQSDIGSSPMGLGEAGEGQSEGYVEYELMVRPNKEFPDGAVIRVLGDGGQETIIRWAEESIPGPLPYVTPDGHRLFNIIHACYEPIGGRLWARGPLESILSKQDQINQLDSLIQLIVQRMGNPVWLEPKGAEVKKFTGEPGLVVKYNPLTVGNAKPEKIEGSNIPITLLQLREQLFNDVERMAGTYDIIKGAKPSGVEAFSALQLLVERSQSRFAIPLQERGDAYKMWYAIALELERQFGPDERTWHTLGPNQTWTYEQFKRANLNGSIEILIEDGSQMPKTSLGKRASIEQLRQMNILPMQDPDVQYSVLRAFGQTDLMPALDYHVKASLQEQDAFERWAMMTQPMPQEMPMTDPATGLQVTDPQTGQPATAMQMGVVPPPVNPQSGRPLFGRKEWHNDMVHLAEHTKWLNSDKMRQILDERPWVEPYAMQLFMEHQMAIQAQMMQQAAMQNEGKPGGGGRALGDSNRESGNPNDQPSGTGQRADNRGPE
jgi:hypothetical protein